MHIYSFVRVFGHDDCDIALCRAWSKKQAIKKFRRMYCDTVTSIDKHKIENCVSRVRFNRYRISVLSDY